MKNVESILDIIETTLWTGSLKNEKPLSVMLIASVGSGKSEILRKSYKPPKINIKWIDAKDSAGNPTKEKKQTIKHIGSVLYTTDTTPYILYNRYGDLLKSEQIKHIVIPDFLSVLTKDRDTMPNTIRFYNSLIEEGICRIESKYSDFITEIPIKIGLITALSFQDHAQRSARQNWGALGFLSRLLPVSYHYSNSSKDTILTSTFLREYHNEIGFKLDLPSSPAEIDLPTKYMALLKNLALELKDPDDETGARRLKQLMTFVMATALKNGQNKIRQKDIDKLQEYSKYFNSECKAEL